MSRKRSAAEPPDALLEREPDMRADAPRPGSITLGAALVLGRGLASAAWLIGWAVVWPEEAAELGLDADETSILFWLFAVLNGIVMLVLLLFAWLIWRGSNTARVITMLVLTLSIVISAAGYFSAGEEITVHTTLLTVALDILVLLALSSRDARAWARSRREARADRKRKRGH